MKKFLQAMMIVLSMTMICIPASSTFILNETLPFGGKLTVLGENHSPDKPLCVTPINNSFNISITTRLITENRDVDFDLMSITFYWINDTLIQINNNVSHYTQTFNLSLTYNTTYSWFAVANDSILENTSDMFSFTTLSAPIINNPPDKPVLISPANNSVNISIHTTLNVLVNDSDNDSLFVTFHWSNGSLIEDFINSTNGVIGTSELSLEYNTTYDWYVLVNDSMNVTMSDIFTFSTIENNIPFLNHSMPRIESNGTLYMIYKDIPVNESILNIFMGDYTNFSVSKFNYTSDDWDSIGNSTINTNDYIRVQIDVSDMPYIDTLIPIIPQIRFKISDDDLLHIEVSSNSSGDWSIIDEHFNISEGWFTCNDENMNEYNTTYYYHINVTDSFGLNISLDFSFVTTSTLPILPPLETGYDIYTYMFLAIVIITIVLLGFYLVLNKKR